MASKVAITLFFLFLCLPLGIQCSTSNSWVKAGYYYSQTELPVSDVDSALFTHLIFAFAYVNSSSYELAINSSDSQKFSTFSDLVKRKNPSVTAILSIWVGREQSSTFFSKLSQSSLRKSFIDSSIRAARLNGFEGLDLCGVEPRKDLDMTTLRTLLAEWRVAIDSDHARNKNQPRLLLVMLAHHVPSLDSVSYPIEAMKNNLDWVHLKSYDYSMPTKTNITFPHAALYDSSSNQGVNTNNSIQELINRRGFPANSIYNDTYVVNFCTIGQTWINYDDVEAIRAKVSYAKKLGLLGYSVFQIGSDSDNWALSRAAQEAAGNHHENKTQLLAIVLITSAIFFLLLGTVFLCLIQRRFSSEGISKILKSLLYKMRIISDAGNLNRNAPNLQVLSYTSVKVATNNFSSQNKLGEGGYGPVYKGKFQNGQEIAVKRLSKTSNQGPEEFKNEVMLLAKLQHVNLVRLLGYCTEKEEKMLIYEYMPNKSLDVYLFDPERKHILDWQKRVNIIEGITQGLLYLQEYSNFTIIHRDLKASNILLDDDMNPKISDFGLARIFKKDENEANTDRIVGTLGYVPPEYVKRGIYSMKYDVYSFGVLLLQIISGKRNTCLYGSNENLNLLEYAYELWYEGRGMMFVESTLDDSSSTCKILRCMQVALLCVQENPIDRPSMLEVSSMLKAEPEAILTPKKPAYSTKEDNNEHCTLKVRDEICSVNDFTISEMVPR